MMTKFAVQWTSDKTTFVQFFMSRDVALAFCIAKLIAHPTLTIDESSQFRKTATEWSTTDDDGRYIEIKFRLINGIS